MGVVGKLFDKYGHRKMAVLITAGFGAALFYMSTVNSIFMLLIGFFLIRLLGQGSMGLIGGTLVPQWFIRKRGRAKIEIQPQTTLAKLQAELIQHDLLPYRKLIITQGLREKMYGESLRRYMNALYPKIKEYNLKEVEKSQRYKDVVLWRTRKDIAEIPQLPRNCLKNFLSLDKDIPIKITPLP